MEKTPEYIEFLKTRISPNVDPEIAKLMIEYALTPEEHKKALDKIMKYCFLRKEAVNNPKIFLIISQTGGGKSSLTSTILKNNPNTVVIDSDAFKAFNPRKNEICSKHPTLYGYLTGIDAYLHRDEVYQHAIKNGYNILIEIAPSTKERLFNIDFEELKKYGYKTDANVLAVSKINSLLSVHERYEGQIESKMSGPKLTDYKRANDSYDAVELVLRDLIDMRGIDLKIWKRGLSLDKDKIPTPVVVANKKEDALKIFKQTRKADEIDSIESASDRISVIKNQMKSRRAPVEQKNQIENVEKYFLELESNNQKN